MTPYDTAPVTCKCGRVPDQISYSLDLEQAWLVCACGETSGPVMTRKTWRNGPGSLAVQDEATRMWNADRIAAVLANGGVES